MSSLWRQLAEQVFYPSNVTFYTGDLTKEEDIGAAISKVGRR